MKTQDIRKMNQQELENYLTDLRKELFNIRTKKVTDVEENPARRRKTRREIARVLTVLNEAKKESKGPN